MRPHAVSAVFILSVCLLMTPNAWSAEDAYKLVRSGNEMTADEKVALEAQVAKNPNDVDSRTKLLAYYFMKGRQDADAKSAKQRHVIWLVENAPESQVLGLPYGHLNQILEPEGYHLAKQAWLKTIGSSPDKLGVLKNASRFFQLHDRKLSEELLVKGQTLDAKDPFWPSSLGRLYALELISNPPDPARKAIAEKAYRHFEKAYELSNAIEQDALLSDLAKTALAADLREDARAVAAKMLTDDADGWNRGNRVHHGNLILGQIALLDGNVAEAKSKLLLAGKTPGSPQLNSFGPNMLLAQELLERSEKDVVLEYFELCRKFWASGGSRLDAWTQEVKSNRIPQFGGNLSY